MDSDTIADSSKLLGKRVRSIRLQRKETLDQLAQTTGLNKGYLSRIESGEKSPSIATLLKLTSALQVSTSQLFGEVVAEGDIHLVRAGGKARARGKDRYEVISLSRGSASPGLETFLLRPTLEFEQDRRAEHDGTEGLYVLEGDIELQFSDRVVALSTGDYVQFPGHLTHQVRRTTPTAMVLVVVAES